MKPFDWENATQMLNTIIEDHREHLDEAKAFGMKSADFDLEEANAMLNGLIQQHKQNMDDAKAFGMKSAASPKNLMPYAEAKQIVESFSKDTEKAYAFVGNLEQAYRHSAPDDLKPALAKLIAKGQKTLKVFEANKKKAETALDKHEEMLVGAVFQKAFESLRMAVLKIKLQPDIDVDFETTLDMNANPPFAAGGIKFIREGQSEPVMRIWLGYRAATDYYYGNIVTPSKTYKSLVVKQGQARTSTFVKALAEQAIAVDKKESVGVFHTRKSPAFVGLDPKEVKETVAPKLTKVFLKIFNTTEAPSLVDWKFYGQGCDVTVNVEGWGRSAPTYKAYGFTYQDALDFITNWNKMAKRFSKPFTFKQKGAVWQVTPKIVKWEYVFTGSYGSTQGFNKQNLKKVWPVGGFLEASDKVPASRLKEVKNILVKRQGFSPSNNDPAAIIEAYRNLNKGEAAKRMQMANGCKITYTVQRVSGKAAAIERIATRYFDRRIAGGEEFVDFIHIPDARRAFDYAIEEAQHESGSRGYTGTIAEKGGYGYKIRSRDPLTREDAGKFINKDIGRCDKWGPAFAIPVSEEQVVKRENVTVVVKESNERTARKKGIMMIKATGRIPPGVSVLVTVKKVTQLPSTGRTKEFEVIGERRLSKLGKTTGWYFYGVASS